MTVFHCRASKLDCERQGQEYTRKWMEANCRFVVIEETMISAIREYTTFAAKLVEDGAGQV